jgi:hypothetical protein
VLGGRVPSPKGDSVSLLIGSPHLRAGLISAVAARLRGSKCLRKMKIREMKCRIFLLRTANSSSPRSSVYLCGYSIVLEGPDQIDEPSACPCHSQRRAESFRMMSFMNPILFFVVRVLACARRAPRFTTEF